ncbi:MAG: DEAD/DEAH box helicase family protein [Candidatus Aenigmarchaeota archaeon]|nr:DEAD/DEAH box helicase family protein [Candidatus Aenigmarchaeota archaeon]
MSAFVSHPLIKPNTMESRKYQESILATAASKNLLCVLPTGLGKTNIAILLAALKLEKHPESKILVTAPTRPLVSQHHKTFSHFLNIPEEKFHVITGTTKPEDRESLYLIKQIIFATPQTLQNDLEEHRLNLKEFSLLVIDEIHHAVGDYAYPYIAKAYLEQAKSPRILGLTASPGGTREKIHEICRNTGIDTVEIKTEQDEDVIEYIKEKEIDWIKVELPEAFGQIRDLLRAVYNKKVETLRRMKFARSRVTKKDLLELQAHFIKSINQGNKNGFIGISVVSPAIKIEHAIGLLETQGITSLENYWKKLREDESKGAKSLIADKIISNAMFLTRNLAEQGYRHPKISKLCSLVSQQMKEKQDSKIIIFATYRDAVREIVEVLGKLDNVKPVEFIGQGRREKGTQGITQKEQGRRLEDFRSGEYNTLVCTSIGEEGLDIPSMDLAVFYEPVPSEIRQIQRRGRVGRAKIGKVIILMTTNTRDETYYWVAHVKEKRMKSVLYGMKFGTNQSNLKDISSQDQ